MNITILYYILILLAFGLAFFVIHKLFRFLERRANSPYRPYIKALTTILIAFLISHGMGNQILNILLDILRQNTTLQISPPNNYTSLIGEIAFYISVVVIMIYYGRSTVQVDNKKPLTQKEKTYQGAKIDFPKNNYQDNPIFHESIKTLFELKFEKEKLKLDWDSEYKILYGSYTQGLHSYACLIYCSKGLNQLINQYEIDEITKKMDDFLIKSNQLSSTDIKNKYILIEKGKFQNVKSDKIIYYTEEELLNNLIDFSDYLNKVIYDFENEELAFSSETIQDKKMTLKQTFIEPEYLTPNSKNTQETDNNIFSKFFKKKYQVKPGLKKYINQWLLEESKKHLVILGDYGMGKSSFLKYYTTQLAQEYISTKKIRRFPIFISLTNTSPMHGGIDNEIGRFVADNLGISKTLFDELKNRGKFVFILDGFDEMGFVGTHEQRIEQLNAIWQLATEKNKILISGRPSYFPNDEELKYALNIKDTDDLMPPQQSPYFERLYLAPFSEKDIRSSIELYNYSNDEVAKYLNFIKGNRSILELCKRPSMMHIVREMLPILFEKYQAKELNAGKLFNQYISHWIDRQLNKGVISTIRNDQKKKEFVLSCFIELAGHYYEKGVEKLPPKEVLESLVHKIKSLELSNNNEIEGLESEILTGFFIEIDKDRYKFVHKSFKEYLVSQKIIQLIENQHIKSSLINQTPWTTEIIDFIYDSDFVNNPKKTAQNIPLLLLLSSKSKTLLKLKCKLFRLVIVFKIATLKGRQLFLKWKKYLSRKKKKGVIPNQILEVSKDKKLNSLIVVLIIIGILMYFLSKPSKLIDEDIEDVPPTQESPKIMSFTSKAFYIALHKGQLHPKNNRNLIKYFQLKYGVFIDIEQ